MKILVIGLDDSILENDSKLRLRSRGYADSVEKYFVISRSKKSIQQKISHNFSVFGVAGGKIICFFNIYFLARKIIKEEKIDLISVQDQYYLAALGFFLSRLSGIALEIQVHGLEKYYGFRKTLSGFFVHRADAIRTVSQRLERWIKEEFSIPAEKITAVPIFSGFKACNNKIEKLRFSKKFVFLTVSRLVVVKNIALQIKALAELVGKYPMMELWIVGDGPERKKLEDLTHLLHVSHSVNFFGWKKDVKYYYENAACFMLTSDYEGWGQVVVEAASCGLPIIMTDVGCAGEFIQNGKSGLLIKIDNLEELVKAMETIYSDEVLRATIGAGALTAIEKLPDKEKTFILYKSSWEKAKANAVLRLSR
jgi:glycosyltransferase involved in cell wall biosynthesis